MSETSELAASPDGEVTLVWDRGALAKLAGGATPAGPLWRLEGRFGDRFSLVRVVSATLEDGGALGVVALRPAGASGHGEELVAAALATPEGIVELDETLLSTEYGPDGDPRRIAIELFRPGEGVPLRASGVRHDGGTGDDAGAVSMSFNLGGIAGEALFESNRLA